MLVDRTHRLHHAKHRGDDTQGGQRIGQALQDVVGLIHFVEVRLHGIVHDFLDRVNFQRARGHHDQGQRVADQMDQRLVREQAREFGEDRRVLRLGHMAFQRHRAFAAQQLHQPGRQRDRVDVVLLVVLRALGDLLEAAAQPLELVHRVAGDERADRGAADDEHLVGNGVHDRAERTAGDGEAPEDHDEQDDDPDDSEHAYLPL
jgi:hypothetical protein